jgi:hypothetical protein
MERQPHEVNERVLVLLVNNERVEGNIHVPRHSRVLDILNHHAADKPFIALTDVKWHTAGETHAYPFICLHRGHIISLQPLK